MPDKCVSHSYTAALAEYIMGGCTENECRLCGTPKGWRDFNARHAGIPSFPYPTPSHTAPSSSMNVEHDKPQRVSDVKVALNEVLLEPCKGCGKCPMDFISGTPGPSGGITVPSEPTMEMWIAGNKKLPATPIEDSTDYTRAIWKAMLDASPYATGGSNS